MVFRRLVYQVRFRLGLTVHARHVIIHILDSHFLSQLASYDVASIIRQALVSGNRLGGWEKMQITFIGVDKPCANGEEMLTLSYPKHHDWACQERNNGIVNCDDDDHSTYTNFKFEPDVGRCSGFTALKPVLKATGWVATLETNISHMIHRLQASI